MPIPASGRLRQHPNLWLSRRLFMKTKQLYGKLPNFRRKHSTGHFANTKAHLARGTKTGSGSEVESSLPIHQGFVPDKQQSPHAACLRLTFRNLETPQTHVIRIGGHVPAPAHLVAKLWKEFDLLPHFMRGPAVNHGHQRCVWIVNLDGRQVPWNAEPETLASANSISWKSCRHHGIWNEGSIRFHGVRPHVCRLAIEARFQLPYAPHYQNSLAALTLELERMIDHFISFVGMRKKLPSGSETIFLK